MLNDVTLYAMLLPSIQLNNGRQPSGTQDWRFHISTMRQIPIKAEKSVIGLMPTCSEIFASAIRGKMVDRHCVLRVG